ncbi:hypothetical protein OCOJLMKI_4976 [Methylobacterium iners]|uniref:Uncharacterized protein n=1 Tax=Methylobacterium iners TaxID=418707 RepID=A0ABQ4S7G5_9HYPH|nr:hypothetical protein OCOJLMKI_4976 [Methylobacterium iners]
MSTLQMLAFCYALLSTGAIIGFFLGALMRSGK